MKSDKFIIQFIRKTQRAGISLIVMRSLERFIPIFLVGLTLLAWVDSTWAISLKGRQLGWLFILLLSIFGAVYSLYPFRQFQLKWKSKRFSERNENKANKVREDELVVAYELASEPPERGISQALKDDYLEEVSKTLKNKSPWLCFNPWKLKQFFLLFIIPMMVCGFSWSFIPSVAPLNARIFFPFFYSDIQKFLQILPGNGNVPWGADLLINIHVKNDSYHRPEVYVKGATDWRMVQPEEESSRTQTFRVRHVVEPVQYRVRWREDWSQKYVVVPLPPIQIQRFDIQLKDPAYVGGNTHQQVSPEISGLAGTGIFLKALVDGDWKSGDIVFEKNGVRSLKKKGNMLEVQFNLDGPDTYWFNFETSEGKASGTHQKYPIHVIPDQSPEIVLLSPIEDLIIGDKEKLPITYSATDDYGVVVTLIEFGLSKTKTKRQKMHVINPPEDSILRTFNWDPRRDGFGAGDIIYYRILAEDGNIITGPGQSVSPWRILEISSFEKSHEKLEITLDEWRNQLLDQLADMTAIREELNKPDANLDALHQDFAQKMYKSDLLEDALNEILKMMENDPLADYGVWLEHEAISENLEAMNEGPMKGAKAGFQTKNLEATKSNLDEVNAELERMAALSEDLKKRQETRDLLSAVEELERRGEELVDQVEMANQSPNDDSIRKQIQDTLEQARKLLGEMAKSLEEMPEQLPEDFVNQEALKNLEMGKTKDILEEINDAMNKGNMSGALKMAQEFLKSAQNMASQMNEAHQSYMESMSSEGISKEMEEKVNVLDKIIEEQREILSETNAMETDLLRKKLKKQEEILGALAERQRKLISLTQSLLGNSGLEAPFKINLTGQMGLMQGVMGELESKTIDQSPVWLKSLTQSLTNLLETRKSSGKLDPIQTQLEKIRDGEQSILDDLIKSAEVSIPPTPDQRKDMDSLRERQIGNQRSTAQIKEEIQRLSQKTATLGLNVTGRLGMASDEMKSAGKNLGDGNVSLARGDEEKALAALMEANQSMQNAMQTMSGMGMPGGMQMGGSGGMKNVIRRDQTGGKMGTGLRRVRLPTVDEYRPPKEFREELLESLKEKYPKTYEKIIHKYYKRLAD